MVFTKGWAHFIAVVLPILPRGFSGFGAPLLVEHSRGRVSWTFSGPNHYR
jgi:hypothetical protein